MIDDPAPENPSGAESVLPRVSAVKSIVKTRKEKAPTLPQVFAAFHRAQRDTRGFVTDEKVLRAYVHALEGLYPRSRFAMRVTEAATERAHVVQAATHRITPSQLSTVTVTEAGLTRAGIRDSAPSLVGLSLRRTYEPILETGSTEAASFADGFDAPLCRDGQVIGVLVVEFDRREPLPEGLEAAILVAASQASSALQAGSLRREATHLRDYLDKLLEHANIPVLVVGRDRGIRVVSRAFARITGLPREGMVAKDVLQLAPQNERVGVLSAFVSVLRGRSVPPFELRLPKADGGSARLLFKLAPILSSEGRVAGVIAIGQDRTEVRELEGQVIHAEKLATLGQLAAGIVHEINNPLTSITVYGEYLLGKLGRGGAESADLKRVERILRSADRIMSFTRNLLTYARPTREDARQVCVNEILDEALDFCEHLAREANVTLVPDYAPDLPEVSAVPGQLHQVFVNLITNACNAAHEEGGVLSVRSRLDGDGRVQVLFEDNGIGISPANLAQVFEPFFSTRRRGKGTGLGLSIVKNIIEQHRGRIHIESDLGRRTQVSVSLPTMAKRAHKPRLRG